MIEYFCGIDTYDLDSECPIAAICVISRRENNETFVEYSSRVKSKEELDEEVERIKKLYNNIKINVTA